MSSDKVEEVKTAIAYGVEETIYIRGYSVIDMLETVDFASVFYLLFRGELPSKSQSRMVNAILVSVCDHGITPSSLAARILASCGAPIQSAVAAGVSTIADHHGGACEQMGHLLQEAQGKVDGGHTIADVARELIDTFISTGTSVPGFGHSLHRAGDPRAAKLSAIAYSLGLAGSHLALLEAIADEIARRKGKRIEANVDGVIAAIGSDMGFTWRMMRAFVFVSRAAGLAAHVTEEQEDQKGWARWGFGLDPKYSGVPIRPVPKP